MDMFNLAEFETLKFIYHTIDTYSGFHWASALRSEKTGSVITCLLEAMAMMDIL